PFVEHLLCMGSDGIRSRRTACLRLFAGRCQGRESEEQQGPGPRGRQESENSFPASHGSSVLLSELQRSESEKGYNPVCGSDARKVRSLCSTSSGWLRKL